MENTEWIIGYFKHIKTGKIYNAVGCAINATNANDGQTMVVYRNDDNNYFTREINEFKEKFEVHNRFKELSKR